MCVHSAAAIHLLHVHLISLKSWKQSSTGTQGTFVFNIWLLPSIPPLSYMLPIIKDYLRLVEIKTKHRTGSGDLVHGPPVHAYCALPLISPSRLAWKISPQVEYKITPVWSILTFDFYIKPFLNIHSTIDKRFYRASLILWTATDPCSVLSFQTTRGQSSNMAAGGETFPTHVILTVGSTSC